MSLRRNLNIPGHAHELTFSCYQRHAFLARERTCRWLTDALDKARHTHDFALWAYVFMPDHVHLIVFPHRPVYEMAVIRRSIKEPVSREAVRYLVEYAPDWLLKITRKRGKREERLFWQPGGGYDRNIDEPATLWRMVDYLHNNPVRKDLVQRAVDWPWSSAAWYAGGESPLAVDSSEDAWGRA